MRVRTGENALSLRFWLWTCKLATFSVFLVVGYSLYSSSPYPLWVRFLPPLAPLVSVSNGAGSIATA
ncbi:MAG: hypothetical protein ACYTKD_22640, partial [Planctomycetota bacterium]